MREKINHAHTIKQNKRRVLIIFKTIDRVKSLKSLEEHATTTDNTVGLQ